MSTRKKKKEGWNSEGEKKVRASLAALIFFFLDGKRPINCASYQKGGREILSSRRKSSHWFKVLARKEGGAAN